MNAGVLSQEDRAHHAADGAPIGAAIEDARSIAITERSTKQLILGIAEVAASLALCTLAALALRETTLVAAAAILVFGGFSAYGVVILLSYAYKRIVLTPDGVRYTDCLRRTRSWTWEETDVAEVVFRNEAHLLFAFGRREQAGAARSRAVQEATFYAGMSRGFDEARAWLDERHRINKRVRAGSLKTRR